MATINQAIPHFKAETFHQGEFKTLTSENVKGKWAVFMFYPADFTFVCPTELGDVADHYEELKSAGVEVYAVSTDTHFVHKAWHEASDTIKKIQYPMLGDPKGELTRAFGVMDEESGLAFRGTFVIDPDGIIRAYEVHSDGIGRSADELVRKVRAAQYIAANDGEVCPASWQPGKETLKPGLDLVGKI